MQSTQGMLRDYINFDDQATGLSAAEKTNKELTFCGAAAVSLLCNEQEQDACVIGNLRTSDRFKFIRDLDLISSIWPLTSVAQKVEIKSTPPVLAWSQRLQTIFVGLCCTRDMRDVRSDLDVRLKAPEGVGSRFHAGFLDRSHEFVALVQELTKRHKVVVCGHSFGGALASTSTYLTMIEMIGFTAVPNAWEDSKLGLSVITFGSPSCYVAEPQGTTTSLRMDFSRNFHHVINPHDYIPFALNDATRRFKEFESITTNIQKVSPTIRAMWPLFDFFLDYLAQTEVFCNLGCLYSIVTDRSGIRNYRQILMEDDIPEPPNPVQVERYHSMPHYYTILRDSIASRLPQVLPQSSQRNALSPDAVPSTLLSLPDMVKACSCVVHSDRLTVSIQINTLMAQYLLKRITFKKGNDLVDLPMLGISKKPGSKGQSYVELGYQINEDEHKSFADIGEASTAIQRGITIHDVFGRSTNIHITSMQMMGLNEASLPATLGSIRLVMIRAFVTQTSRVQDLKSKSSTSGRVHTDAEIARLDDRIKPVVQHVDSLVADASPHLVVGRLEHAFKILEELWPRDFEEASKTYQPVPGGLSNDLAEEKDTTLANKLIPRNCPQSLRKILNQMLLDQKTPPVTLAALSVKDWEAASRPSVKEQFINVPSLAQTLQVFSQKLYRRSTITAERTKEAIEQFQDVIGTIQLCHLIIITQLDAPYEWYCTSTEGHRKKSAAISILPSCLSGTSAWSRVLAWQLGLGAATIIGLTGGFAVLYAGTTFVNLFLNKHKEYLNLSFPGALGITLQALGLPVSDSEPIVEKTLLECVYQDIPTSRTPATLEKWKNRLAEGLKKYPGVETNQWSITPTFFWPQWLFSIAKVAQLRVHLHGKICIGVQGSTEGGKSQMLTVLTGAAEDYFKPGSDSLCRTLGIQSYDSDRLGAVFIDCPGFDDQTPQIKYMAEAVQELFAVVIIVIPMERTRSEAMESALNIAIKLLRNREDFRPIRILLSKADRLEHNRNNKQVFRNTLADVKEQFMNVLKSELGDGFTTFRQQPFHDGVITKSETLEDIVKPFSTHAQMSLEDTKALADCPPGTECKIERASHFENLCELADKGELWDVHSLRTWLWDLSPKSVPLPKERVREYF